jgi:hypothetical protein
MTRGTVIGIEVRSGDQIAGTGLDGSRGKLAVNAGIKWDLDNLFFERKWGISGGDRWMTIAQVKITARRQEGKGKQKAKKESTLREPFHRLLPFLLASSASRTPRCWPISVLQVAVFSSVWVRRSLRISPA